MDYRAAADSGMLARMAHVDDISLLLTRELEGFRREVALHVDDESLWRTVPGFTNAVGNLALHVAGNLQHFVGAQIGGTGFVRNRDAEFATRSGARADVDRALVSAIEAVTHTLAGMTEMEFDEPMPGVPNGLRTTRGRFLMHLVAHTAFHLGQAGYARRVLTGEGASSASPLPLDVLGT